MREGGEGIEGKKVNLLVKIDEGLCVEGFGAHQDVGVDIGID